MPHPRARLALMLTALVAVAACSEKTSEPTAARSVPEAASGAGAEVLVYVCDDGQTVRASYPDPQTAVVEHQGRARTLKIARAASGARYVGDGLQWWTQGMTRGTVAPLAAGEEIASAAGVACAVAAPPAAPAAPPVAVTPPASMPAPAPPLAADPTPRPVRPAPGEELIEPSRDLGGVLPLKHGIFVASDVRCEDAPNAAIRRYDGRGLSGAHSRACRAKVLSQRGKTYEIEQSCIDAGAGPAPRSTERQTIVIDNNLDFVMRRKAGEQRFRYCAASMLPAGVR